MFMFYPSIGHWLSTWQLDVINYSTTSMMSSKQVQLPAAVLYPDATGMRQTDINNYF